MVFTRAYQLLCSAESPASGADGYIATGMTFLNLRKFMPNYDDLISSLQSKLSSDGSTDQQQNQLAFVTSNTSTVVEWVVTTVRIVHESNPQISRILLEGQHETTEATDGNSSYVTFLTLMQQPFSRGSTVSMNMYLVGFAAHTDVPKSSQHASSASAFDYPTINPNYFDVRLLCILWPLAK